MSLCLINRYRQREECDEGSKCFTFVLEVDRLCDLVVRVSDYRSTGPGFDSLRYQIF
jgi:hypothetical protein